MLPGKLTGTVITINVLHAMNRLLDMSNNFSTGKGVRIDEILSDAIPRRAVVGRRQEQQDRDTRTPATFRLGQRQSTRPYGLALQGIPGRLPHHLAVSRSET